GGGGPRPARARADWSGRETRRTCARSLAPRRPRTRAPRENDRRHGDRTRRRQCCSEPARPSGSARKRPRRSRREAGACPPWPGSLPLRRALPGSETDDKLRRMPRRRVGLSAVTALFLERQHLARPRALPLTPGRLRRFVEDVGGLQLDSINVLDRAHYLTVWSRFGPYDRARLDRLIYRRRLLFEYWAHAACLVPASTLPRWRRAMLDYPPRHPRRSGCLA